MDQEVVRERVPRVEGEDGLEGRHELLRARLRRPLGRPEVPGPQVRERLGEEGAHVGVLRVGGPHPAHRVGVRLLEGLAVLGLRHGVAGRERLDQGLLDGPGLRRRGPRPGERLPRRLRPLLRHHGVVDVGAVRVGDAPPGHRAAGVEGARVSEGPDGLVVVERVEEGEALVEVALRFRGRRRHRPHVRPEAVVEWRGSCRESRRTGQTGRDDHDRAQFRHGSPPCEEFSPRPVAGRAPGFSVWVVLSGGYTGRGARGKRGPALGSRSGVSRRSGSPSGGR